MNDSNAKDLSTIMVGPEIFLCIQNLFFARIFFQKGSKINGYIIVHPHNNVNKIANKLSSLNILVVRIVKK